MEKVCVVGPLGHDDGGPAKHPPDSSVGVCQLSTVDAYCTAAWPALSQQYRPRPGFGKNGNNLRIDATGVDGMHVEAGKTYVRAIDIWLPSSP